MESELDNQSWESDHIAEMLSPKRLKRRAKPDHKPANPLYPTLPDFDFLIDEPELKDQIRDFKGGDFDAKKWPQKGGSVGPEPPFYPLIVDLLNSMTEELEGAYRNARKAQGKPKSAPNSKFPQLKEKQHRWFPHGLKFLECANQAVKDGIDGAFPLKPDFICIKGGDVKANNRRFSWGQPNTENESGGQIQQVGEVKKTWPELMAQLLTYMRAMRTAFPDCLFRIGYAFCHGLQEFRVIIHHHGGITATKAFDLRERKDRIKLQTVFFSMLCWQNPADAGFTWLTNGVEYNIPHLGRWRYHSIYFQSHCGRGRATRVIKVVRQDGPPPTGDKSTINMNRAETTRRSRKKDGSDVNAKAGEDERASVGTKRSHTISIGSKEANAPTSFKSLKSSAIDSPSSGSRAAPPTAEAETIYPIRSAYEYFPLGDFPGPADAKWVKETPTHSRKSCTELVIKMSSPAVKDDLPTELQFVNEQICFSKSDFTPFGLAEYVCAYLPHFPEDWLSSNSIFIPHLLLASGFERFPATDDYYWHWRAHSPREPPSNYDVRLLLVIVSSDQGEPLVKCQTADDIARCMFSVMMGYSAAFSRGWIQRDPSIGNALKLTQKRPDSLERTLFLDAAWDTKRSFFKGLSDDTLDLVELYRTTAPALFAKIFTKAPASAQKEYEDLKAESNLMWLRYQILEAAESLDLANHCVGIQTDFDLAAKLDDYVEERTPGASISGTVQFLSTRLLSAATQRAAPVRYLHSTIDDLWAHFYTMVWAVVNCQAIGNPAGGVQHARNQLRDSRREKGVLWVVEGPHDSEDPPIVTEVKALCHAWFLALGRLNVKYETSLAQERGSSLRSTMEFAMLEGVLEFISAYRQWKEAKGA